jgi:cytochrome c biogenesis protein CcdA
LVTQAHNLAAKAKDTSNVLALSALVVVIELVWTGALYTVIVTILNLYSKIVPPTLLALYGLVLVMPLIVTTILIASNTKISSIRKFRDRYGQLLQLIMGMLLLGLGIYGIVLSNGAMRLE